MATSDNHSLAADLSLPLWPPGRFAVDRARQTLMLRGRRPPIRSPLPTLIDLADDSPRARGAMRPVFSVARQFLALDWFDRICQHLQVETDPATYVYNALAMVGVEYQVEPAASLHVPQSGPLIIVANHPFGCLDGLILADLLSKVRPDFKMFGNRFLERLAPLRDRFIFVDPFASDTATRGNIAPIRRAVEWLSDGNALFTFPAGEVAHWRMKSLSIVDGPWNSTVARLARRTNSAILPIFVDGRNSALFQIAGTIHPLVRTSMLLREVRNKRGRRITIRVGPVIGHDELRSLSPADMTRELRARTLSLGDQHRATPIVSLGPDRLLAAEIHALESPSHLVRTGDWEVLCAPAEQIPRLLNEIGRLREVAFRAAGEGTGREQDLDRFDRTYLHLFLWHHGRRQIVGAYRMGLCDQILAKSGPSGLYLDTLFELLPTLLRQLDGAIELGRSFIRPEYQRAHQPLMLLWKGIGRFIAAHPRYAILIGPVSISRNYRDESRQLILDMLDAHHRLPEAHALVAPRMAWSKVKVQRHAQNVRELDHFLATIEPDAKRIPVLLRQYLALGAKMIDCNVDPNFGNCVDALMYADLRNANPRLLTRYMGLRESQAFLAMHIMKNRGLEPPLGQPATDAAIEAV